MRPRLSAVRRGTKPLETPKKLEEPKQKEASAPAVSPPNTAIKYDPKYPRQVALILAISHIVFAISISIWYLHIYILKPNGFGCIIYLLEFPGAIILKIIGQNQNTESEFVYFLAFFINTIFYGLIGYLLGRIFQRYGWDNEVESLCKLETEVYEKKIEPKKI